MTNFLSKVLVTLIIAGDFQIILAPEMSEKNLNVPKPFGQNCKSIDYKYSNQYMRKTLQNPIRFNVVKQMRYLLDFQSIYSVRIIPHTYTDL